MVSRRASGATMRSRAALCAQMRQHVRAAGNLDQLGYPADAADQRIVPFLEIDLRPRSGARHCRDRLQPPCEVGCELFGAVGGADHRAQGADHRKDSGEVTLVEDMDRDAGADELSDDVGLQVGEGEHEIGRERQDLRNVGGDEGRDARLLAADLRWPHRIAGDADDPVLLAEQVECLDRLFGQANDPAGREVAHCRG